MSSLEICAKRTSDRWFKRWRLKFQHGKICFARWIYSCCGVDIYHPVIKHGLLENGPLKSVLFLTRNLHSQLVRGFSSHVADETKGYKHFLKAHGDPGIFESTSSWIGTPTGLETAGSGRLWACDRELTKLVERWFLLNFPMVKPRVIDLPRVYLCLLRAI